MRLVARHFEPDFGISGTSKAETSSSSSAGPMGTTIDCPSSPRSSSVRLNVNVIVTHGAAGAVAAKQATTTIPIVIAATGDILALGLVQSLAQPGGNITGSTFFNPELAAKRLELLKEAIPLLSRAALVSNPNNPINGSIVLAMEETARSLKVELRPFETRGPSQLESTFS